MINSIHPTSLILFVMFAVKVFPVNGQLPFSFDRRFISAKSYCTTLKERDPETQDDIVSELTRFDEEPIRQLKERDVFRIVDHGLPGDVKDIVIHRIERIDSTCVVTIKFVRNLRKSQVFVHRKTYDISKWHDFRKLANKYFHTASPYSDEKTILLEESYQKYELNQKGRYVLLTEKEASGDVEWLRDYMDYLLSPIYEYKCD